MGVQVTEVEAKVNKSPNLQGRLKPEARGLKPDTKQKDTVHDMKT